ncbi:hypothetical protein QMO14_30245 [Variovorax sp. CAN2819]|uniref:hypothetical protein n=1 Tax=Variovorax sp. CAN15 TaxID=3046727 RepID=UPI0026471638|nr:hypothetical protein [Variovorax sp. CAN15]MDN6887862.1 hypothetical protein [Variovorax sp. CAN15]
MEDLLSTRGSFFSSLEAAGIANPLGAERRPLQVYGACWCGSEKKWKWCHAIRERQQPVPFGAADNRHRAFFMEGPCLHPSSGPETCSSAGAISSHTVQRGGGLSAIAEQGHVYSAKRAFSDLHKREGQYDMAKVGLAAASTFPGFCNFHDTKLFLPAESPTSALDLENAFLLSFRAVTYEVASKAAQLAAHVDSREFIDNGASFERQREVQNYYFLQQKGMEKAMDDVEALKSRYDEAFLSQTFAEFRTFAVRFDGVLPFAAAGAFMPEFDFAGNKLQVLGVGRVADVIALNITTLGGTTCAVFGWFGGADTRAGKFVQSLKKLPHEQYSNAILNVGLEYLENFFCTPSWWQGLPPLVRTRLLERMVGGFAPRDPNALAGTDTAVSSPVTAVLEA